jgi:secondary thiamine-phosphate synthase enzyme
MFINNFSLSVKTEGRGTYEITDKLQSLAGRAAVNQGLMSVFIHHTSASLIVCENADPSVRQDLERFMARTAPDGDPAWTHDAEGPDDMPAHIRSILTQPSLTIPMSGGRALLGTWQGVYVWEHRTGPHERRVTVTVFGDPPV